MQYHTRRSAGTCRVSMLLLHSLSRWCSSCLSRLECCKTLWMSTSGWEKKNQSENIDIILLRLWSYFDAYYTLGSSHAQHAFALIVCWWSHCRSAALKILLSSMMESWAAWQQSGMRPAMVITWSSALAALSFHQTFGTLTGGVHHGYLNALAIWRNALKYNLSLKKCSQVQLSLYLLHVGVVGADHNQRSLQDSTLELLPMSENWMSTCVEDNQRRNGFQGCKK